MERIIMENNEGVERLLIAIYVQAADDYKKSLLIIRNLRIRKNRNGRLCKKDEDKLMKAIAMRDECENFFNRDPYGLLPDMKPGEISEKLKKQLRES